MENRRDAAQMRRDMERFQDDAWGFGTLMAVVAACFVILGVVIYFFAEDSSTQTAANRPEPSSEQMMKAPPTAEPSTIGQGGSQ